MTQFIGKSLKAAAAAGVLAAVSLGASMNASAAVPNGDDGNGGFILAVWDGTHSVLEYLNQTFEGFNASAGNSWSVDLTGFNAASTSFMVFAADNSGNDTLSKGLFATGVSRSGLDATMGVDQINDGTGQVNTSNSASAASQYINSIINSGCSGNSPCVASSSSSPLYFDKKSLDQFIDYSGSASTALKLFKFVTDDGDFALETITQYGSFALNAVAGTLTYSVGGDTPVPLPAAVWLLVSGLAGCGVIGRRKSKEAAAA